MHGVLCCDVRGVLCVCCACAVHVIRVGCDPRIHRSHLHVRVEDSEEGKVGKCDCRAAQVVAPAVDPEQRGRLAKPAGKRSVGSTVPDGVNGDGDDNRIACADQL